MRLLLSNAMLKKSVEFVRPPFIYFWDDAISFISIFEFIAAVVLCPWEV